jgi:hypothetical protein
MTIVCIIIKIESMFEEIKKQPADIFAETDHQNEGVPPPFRPPRPAANVVVPPIAPAGRSEAPVPVVPVKSFNWKSLLVILGLAVVVVAAGLFLSKMILSSHSPTTAGLPNVSNAVEEQVEVTNEAASESAGETNSATENPPAAPPVEIDTDKDGLTDAREAELGTNPDKTDTDSDGLFDREEVEVYRTNPLSPDTDGDGYLDGVEVDSGYNPNGAGKLFELSD